MTLRDLAALTALTIGLVGAVSAWMDRPGSVAVPAGRSDPGAFVVQRLDSPAVIRTADGSALTPVAQFEARGRTLNIERFKPHQSLANWVPGLRPSTHDIGLGFGPMTDTANVERFNFSHEGASNGLRALFARPRGAMTQDEFERLAPYITNIHLIPATPAVYEQLRRVRIGELVTLRGKLVNVRDAQGRVASTSTTAGDRDCEILWLEELQRSAL
ncbi:MAG TPA: hypothetical protein PLE54_02165 [Burkholderiaceae bacterium]|jgi:hypothetical protein|nr:hypothetical protein [Burkholderiaceae bacterium]HQR69382.1 hypothetical protein [Burkholderiaceae bacterium]